MARATRESPAICLLAPLAFRHRSGIARYQTELVRALAPRIPLHLLLYRSSFAGVAAGDLPEPLQRSTIHRFDAPRFVARNAPELLLRILTAPDLLDPNPRAVISGIATRLLEGLAVDKQGIDLYHGTMNYLPRTLGPARRVVTILDTIPLDLPDQVPRTTRRTFLKPFELREEDSVIFISRSAEAAFLRHFDHPAERRRVVYLGYDKAVFNEQASTGAAGDAPYLLSVGMFEPRKNLARSLAAFEQVSKAHPELKWRITGATGFGHDQFLETLRRSPARSQVELMDIHSDLELAELYRGARALLFPSLTEGFGLPVVEALACGTAVVASKIDAIKEAGGDAFVPVDPTDADSIRDGILEAAFDEASRGRKREKGIVQVRQFDWARTGREHLEVYAKALDCEVGDLSK